MKIAIFIADSNGGYPVPAVKGGAVSTLVEHLVEKNNERQLAEMTVVSYYDKEAVEKAKKYPNIIFKWIRARWVLKHCLALISMKFSSEIKKTNNEIN